MPQRSLQQSNWPIGDIDRFILSQLEQHNIRPVAAADRESLVRRLYQDLIGLPPTPQQVRGFLDDDSPRLNQEEYFNESVLGLDAD